MYLVWLELEIKKKITLYGTSHYVYSTNNQNSDDLGKTQILFVEQITLFYTFLCWVKPSSGCFTKYVWTKKKMHKVIVSLKWVLISHISH